ncbi:hypothetical protein [uncultured Cohaesibacter sp.]|uniref:hypothetical protein n=1 Tax=uncultured Cohaesibacter sp. TaxID=1002546 RepID=UPI0029313D28|nr:hypothetical protein [uncultured Cohaesibacter sp.]
MDGLDYWLYCEEYTIVQAALLVVGCDPGEDEKYVEDWEPRSQPKGYSAVKAGLVNAINAKRLNANYVEATIEDASVDGTFSLQTVNLGEPDIFKTTIHVRELRKFMGEKKFAESIFARHDFFKDHVMERDANSYPPKLSAAIHAFQAVYNNPELTRGKSPKQALEKWLLDHAKECGLTKLDGTPNKNAIKQASEVANWKPTGGATPTPEIKVDSVSSKDFGSPSHNGFGGGFGSLAGGSGFGGRQKDGQKSGFQEDEMDDDIPF